jgi:hypothetical protein
MERLVSEVVLAQAHWTPACRAGHHQDVAFVCRESVQDSCQSCVVLLDNQGYLDDVAGHLSFRMEQCESFADHCFDVLSRHDYQSCLGLTSPRGDEAQGLRACYRLRAPFHTQLGKNALEVRLHCLRTDIQPPSDFLKCVQGRLGVCSVRRVTSNPGKPPETSARPTTTAVSGSSKISTGTTGARLRMVSIGLCPAP